MINRNKVFFLSLLFLILFSCSKDDSAPNQNEDPGTQIQKSTKRGLAYDMKEPADFEALKTVCLGGIIGIIAQVRRQIIIQIMKWNLYQCCGEVIRAQLQWLMQKVLS